MTYTDEQLRAAQNAVDRVGANWDAATRDTIEARLREALTEAGVDIADNDVRSLAEAINSNEGIVPVDTVLGS